MSINELLDTTPPPRSRHYAEERMPNLRGGIPGWVLALIGCLGGALASGIPVIVYIARMPDGPQWAQMREDMTSVKEKLAAQAVIKAAEAETKAAEHAAVEEHNKLIEYKLDQVLRKGAR